MPPPPNDNFANAIVLNGSSGSVQGNNLNSTAEQTEPQPNNGHTVWYVWTVPNNFTSGFAIFRTINPPINLPPNSAPQLRSKLQAFLNTFTGLQEVAYTVPGTVGAFSIGSLIMFPVLGTQTISIRVDIAAGAPEGNFLLEWLPGNGLPMLGKCGQCLTDFQLAVTCVDAFIGPDLTVGDVRHGLYSAVSRKTVGHPSGKYLLRYCGGYYFQPPFNNYIVPQFALLFPGNVGAALTFSPVGGNVVGGDVPPQLGDINIGQIVQGFVGGNINVIYNIWWYDGTIINKGWASGGTEGIAGAGITNAPPLAVAKSQIVNPILTTAGLSGFPVTFNNPGTLNQTFSCDSVILDHSGGAMNFVYWVTFNPRAIAPADGVGIPIGAYLDNSKLQVGASGPPSFSLMKVSPQFAVLVAATNLWDAEFGKTAVVTIQINNQSFVPWSNVNIIPTGFFADQDPAYQPPDSPQLFNGNATFAYSKRFTLTNPVGTLKLTFSDANNNPFPTFTFNFTPLFGITLFRVNKNITINGFLCNSYTFNITNLGNATTLASIVNVTATANGAPIQIAQGVAFGNPVFGASIAFAPFFGNGAPNGGGWNPGVVGQVTVIVKLTAQQQTVIISFAPTDSGNNFPVTQSQQIVQPHP